METSYFYSNINKNETNAQFSDALRKYAYSKSKQVYIIDRPLGEKRYSYSYKNVAVVLIPKSKITFVNFGTNQSEDFQEFIQDFIEDLGAISDKFRYKDVIGRARSWKDRMIDEYCYDPNKFDVDRFVRRIEISDGEDQKKCELIISLLTGSINDIERVKGNVPDNILDKIKQKIILFDGDQTRFIYDKPNKPVITIQGLSGTGKTELLLHKMKDIYVGSETSKILFTCHNKILADSLRKRIPNFFNFMKVEQQIQWKERLLCVHAWGSQGDPWSGAYRYICHFYNIPFQRYSYHTSFDTICKTAMEQIRLKDNFQANSFKHAFDFTFIDESQDFGQGFIDLCSMVTKSGVYVAGDIFQSIFDTAIVTSVRPDHLLSKCYRTDPRTLMFAHALGMGLFEGPPPLRWLEDQEWKACGYTVNKEGSTYYLKREPLRRFEDLQTTNYKSVKIVESEAQQPIGVDNCIIDLLSKIKNDNPTVLADDIGIILLDGSQEAYLLADRLEQTIPREIGWNVNKAYESKQKVRDTVLISNRNNVKGLEFPFVICITSEILNSYSYRNALYTMLTRSFLQSILIVTRNLDKRLKEQIDKGLNNIYTNGYIEIQEPSESEKQRIRTTIQQKENQVSLYDLFYNLCDEVGVEARYRKGLYEGFQKAGIDRAYLQKWLEISYPMVLK